MEQTLNIDEKLKESEQLFKDSLFLEAGNTVSSVLLEHPECIDALNLKGVILDALNDSSGAITSFDKALKSKRGDGTSIKNHLDIYLRDGCILDFLKIYRKHRFFLTPDEGIAYDDIIDEIETDISTINDNGILREFAIIAFKQGRTSANHLLSNAFKQDPHDKEIAISIVIYSLYFDNFQINLDTFKSILGEDVYLEFLTCKNQSLSPTLTKNMNILKCVKCGNNSMELVMKNSAIKCTSCSHEYEVRGGVPILLPKDYDQYSHIEPEYQSSFKDRNKIWTEPHNRNFCVLTNQLFSKYIPYDNKALLKNKYYKIVHWNELLNCFKDHIKDQKNARILDVGAALGNDVYALSRLYPDYDFFGVEIVLDGCINAQRYKGNQRNQFVCADASGKLPFADSSFDFITSINSIEHCRKNMMDEIHRILKPKGKVFIAGPSQKSYIFCSPEHVEAYINLVNTDSQFKTHGLSSDEFMEIFSDFKILRHKSDHFFFRWILDNPCISQMNFDAVEKLYSEFCSVIGKALDADPDAKWYNYIQMFTLSK